MNFNSPADMADRRNEPLVYLTAAVGLFCLNMAHFGGLLFSSGDLVISHYTGDISQFFVPMREFGFAELRAGRIPLWNPHLMSGTPYVGNFQSALFYPLNVIYLFLPVGRAINADVALHLFLFSFFVFAWVRERNIHPLGAFVAAAMAAFSAPIYLRILAGHLTMMDAMAWAPLLLLCVDKIFDGAENKRPLSGWVLAAIGTTAMQLLAGHPQTVFITAVTVGLYCIVRFAGASGRIRLGVAFTLIGICPVLLSAIQLFTGYGIADESMRSGGINEDFATLFSFPPENLLTLLSPAFFGDRLHHDYWGRWAFWDTTAFVGVTGIILALYGALFGTARQRRYAVFMALVLMFIALGRYSPVYRLFALIPGFEMFRGPSKFMFAFVLHASMLAGIGVDRLLAEKEQRRKQMAIAILAIIPAIVLGIVWIAFSTRGAWEHSAWRSLIFEHLSEGWLVIKWLDLGEDFFTQSAQASIVGLSIALATIGLIATLLWMSSHRKWTVYLIAVIAIAEVFVFARTYRSTFSLDAQQLPELEAAYDQTPDDFRVLHIGDTGDFRASRNHAMRVGQSAIWGYEPVFLVRYGFLMSYAAGSGEDLIWSMSQHAVSGGDPFDIALSEGNLDFELDSERRTALLPPLMNLVRCRYLIIPPDRAYAEEGLYENSGYLPRFIVARDYMVLKKPLAVMATLMDENFDPRQTVILEEPPVPEPAYEKGSIADKVAIVNESTDHITLQVEIAEAAILLITDPYSEGWKVHAMPGSDQDEYNIVPADLALRAIPLTAGKHHFRIEYSPKLFEIGRFISILSAILYVCICFIWTIRYFRRHRTKYAE